MCYDFDGMISSYIYQSNEIFTFLSFQLEDEVSGLKKRLDELRKAKNTTMVKREQKVLEVGLPFGKR